MRTVLSVEQVARMGRVGCGAVSQARVVVEGGGERVARRVRLDGGGFVVVVVGILRRDRFCMLLSEIFVLF